MKTILASFVSLFLIACSPPVQGPTSQHAALKEGEGGEGGDSGEPGYAGVEGACRAVTSQDCVDASMREVDAEFGRLGRYAGKPGVQRVFNRSGTVWQEMRTALHHAPSPASAERVNQLADELMLHTGKLSMLIEAEGEAPVGRLLDLSSRLNMLSQRLARLYLLAQSGNRSQGVTVDIEQARN